MILAANDGGTPFSDTSSPGRLEFRTTPIGTTATVVRMTVKNDGAIGIGTTSPWGRLSIDTSNLPAGVPEFTIGSSTRQDLIVTQNGDVGIGKATPIAPLDVKSVGQSTISGIRLENQNDTNITATVYEAAPTTGALELRSGGFQDVRLRADGISYIGTQSPRR